jgi:hypothetical protein
MSIRNKLVAGSLASAISVATLIASTPAVANNAGAFIGGVFATKVLGNMRRNTEAQEDQARAQEYAAQRPVAAAPTQSSAESRIKQLDKMAAGGYITPAEYKQKKKAILDSM